MNRYTVRIDSKFCGIYDEVDVFANSEEEALESIDTYGFRDDYGLEESDEVYLTIVEDNNV